MQTFTLIFIVALAFASTTRIWLAARHIHHIRAHRDRVPDSFAQKISLAAHQKAADYTCAKTALGVFQILLEVLLLLALTLGGGLDALAGYWHEVLGDDRQTIAHGMALIVSTLLLMGLAEIPLSYYRTFVVEQRFNFNKMTPLLFFADLAKHALMAAILGLPLLFVVLWLMEKSDSHWWIYAWLIWIAFNLLLLAIYPTYIAPLFNKFTPLADAPLKLRIEQLLKKCGFEAEGLFVMDGSRRSSHGNAYFTGFGKTRRIVFFDTLLSRLNPAEIEAVLAHELGHFKRRHVIKRIALTFVLSLALLWVLGYLLQQDWFYRGLGVTTPSTAMALLLFFLVMPTFTFAFQPLGSLYSRQHEFEADEYAASHASSKDLTQALVKLYQDNAATLTPDPLHSAFYDSHPPAALRVARLKNLAHNQA